MTEKAHIIDALGENRLLLPALLNEALAANDRSKYLFTLVQMARNHAEQPEASVSDLRAERSAAGITDESLDTVVGSGSKAAPERYHIPRVQAICAQLYEELGRMLEPIKSGGMEEEASFAARLKALGSKPWCHADDLISCEQIDAMTSGERERGDSLHLLVMDMHKVLNVLQGRLASETIDGAQVYEIDESDRKPIAASWRA